MAILNPESLTAGGQEPGAVDNRVSLDPNDPRWKNKIAKWKDGGRYPIVIGGIKLEMDQISPGEFEIVGGEQEPMEEEESAMDESEPTAAPRVNRAVASMMAETQGGY